MKEDHEIIELYWARSESAVHETDEKYGAKLHTLSGRILPEAEDAEECVNDTYLGAWNAMPPQRPLALFAFLARICRNIACDKLDKLRAKKRSAEVSACLLYTSFTIFNLIFHHKYVSTTACVSSRFASISATRWNWLRARSKLCCGYFLSLIHI